MWRFVELNCKLGIFPLLYHCIFRICTKNGATFHLEMVISYAAHFCN